MPRPKRPGAPEPKKRSRNGCWPCKARKVKCGEERPACINCQRTGEACDYSIRLNWEGRKKKNPGFESFNFQISSGSAPGSSRQSSIGSSSLSTAGTSSKPESIATSARYPGSSGGIPPSPRDGKRPSPLPGSSNGVALFVDYGSATDLGVAQDEPLFSPDCANPTFSLPPPFKDDVQDSTLRAAPTSGKTYLSADNVHFQPPFKRLKYSVDALLDSPRLTQGSSPASLSESVTGTNPNFYSSTSLLPIDSPVTPAASSSYSDEDLRQAPRSGQPSPEIRRMSVNSLLIGPPGPNYQQDFSSPESAKRRSLHETPLILAEPTTYYGVDRGFKDLDMGKNDDMNAITGSSPTLARDLKDSPFDGSADDDDCATEFGFGIETNDLDYGPGGYYDKPVFIRIPRNLEPLPSKLRENPMNLLYFHHFMNHTARVLVPHDDPVSNPFRTVLPHMAVTNDNLLSLLLAYSASHRARLLQQPEPATRIALWVQDIFPALRAALNDPNKSISNANIATAIMLASLEIVSPTAFGYTIPWQKHLGLARELIAARPDGLRWTRHWSKEDQVCSFLWSWLAYLDVLGTLSSGPTESSPSWVLEYQIDEHPEEFDEIDCIMGFTTRCVYILAKIAELARDCDRQRIGPDHRVLSYWRPSQEVITKAWTLEEEVKASLALPPHPCKHLHASGDVARWDAREMQATNDAFHWAGLVHLHRRVLGKASEHEDVQAAVLKIHECLKNIRMGGTAEACLLFPMFTAGCDTHDEAQRAKINQRLISVESTGMMQVHKARRLMQKVWETGQPWETLSSSEFIG